MFFVVPVTFSDMFILNINGVFLAFIRLTLLGFCLINCVNTCYFTIFVFIYISGVSSICSEKNCIAFLKRTERYCFFVLDYKYKSIL